MWPISRDCKFQIIKIKCCCANQTEKHDMKREREESGNAARKKQLKLGAAWKITNKEAAGRDRESGERGKGKAKGSRDKDNDKIVINFGFSCLDWWMQMNSSKRIMSHREREERERQRESKKGRQREVGDWQAAVPAGATTAAATVDRKPQQQSRIALKEQEREGQGES